MLGLPQREAGGGESIGTWMTVTQRMLTTVMTKRTSLPQTSPPNQPGARYIPLSHSPLVIPWAALLHH